MVRSPKTKPVDADAANDHREISIDHRRDVPQAKDFLSIANVSDETLELSCVSR